MEFWIIFFVLQVWKLKTEAEEEELSIDAAIVKAYQHAEYKKGLPTKSDTSEDEPPQNPCSSRYL